jgi:hypothetical protein
LEFPHDGHGSILDILLCILSEDRESGFNLHHLGRFAFPLLGLCAVLWSWTRTLLERVEMRNSWKKFGKHWVLFWEGIARLLENIERVMKVSRLVQTDTGLNSESFGNGVIAQASYLKLFVVMQLPSSDVIIIHHFLFRPVCIYYISFAALLNLITKEKISENTDAMFELHLQHFSICVITKRITNKIRFVSPWSAQYFSFTDSPIYILYFQTTNPKPSRPDLPLHHQNKVIMAQANPLPRGAAYLFLRSFPHSTQQNWMCKTGSGSGTVEANINSRITSFTTTSLSGCWDYLGFASQEELSANSRPEDWKKA